MKWLLITTRRKLNPGDQFIRIGVQRLIQAVDPAAVFDELAKDDGENLSRRREFDRAVVCGMPLFWNSPGANCYDVGWWGELIRGWPSEDKRRFLVLGAGSATGAKMPDPDAYLDAIKWVIGRSWAVTTRQTVVDWPFLIQSICPAAFSVVPSGRPRTRKLANFMRNGAHDVHFDPDQADEWRRRAPDLAAWAIREGFEAIAHDEDEACWARELGFREVLNPEWGRDYLPIYRDCSVYVGNRLHGAMAVAAAGGKACAIGYDSRIRMLDRFNVLQLRPTETTPGVLGEFLRGHHAPDLTLRMIRTELLRNLEILRAFAAPE